MNQAHTHPERVAQAVPDHCKLAALLHDAIEDGHLPWGATFTLAADAGAALRLLTRNPSETYAKYIDEIAQAAQVTVAGQIALTVKLADLHDNLHGRDTPPASSHRKRYERALAVLQAAQGTADPLLLSRGSISSSDTENDETDHAPLGVRKNDLTSLEKESSRNREER